MAVDVMRVRQFNSRLTNNKEKSAQIRAEANMINNDISQLCEELSKELGRTITLENAQAEYEAYVADLEVKLTTGEQILDRIEGNNNPVNQPASGVFGQPQVGQINQQVNYQQPQTPQQAVQPQQGGYSGFASMGVPQQFGMPQFTVGNQNQQSNNFGNNATGI